MTITQSILLVLSVKGECEVWHPEQGRCKIHFIDFGEDGKMRVVIGNDDPQWEDFQIDPYGDSQCKIILKPFSSLVDEVKKDPVDNAAVRAFISEVKHHHQPKGWMQEIRSEVQEVVDGYPQIHVFHDGNIDMTIHKDWRIGTRGWAFNMRMFLSLLSEGYGPNIPEAHQISPKEVEKLEGGAE